MHILNEGCLVIIIFIAIDIKRKNAQMKKMVAIARTILFSPRTSLFLHLSTFRRCSFTLHKKTFQITCVYGFFHRLGLKHCFNWEGDISNRHCANDIAHGKCNSHSRNMNGSFILLVLLSTTSGDERNCRCWNLEKKVLEELIGACSIWGGNAQVTFRAGIFL